MNGIAPAGPQRRPREEIHLVPLLLGDGARLFDDPSSADVEVEPVRTVEGPGVTHLKYRVVK